MPTIEENKTFWDGFYKWQKGGDEWSQAWGGPRAQWFGSIFPRIHAFVPTGTILEIACGYGRWTSFLKEYCTHLIAVDISEECIQACKSRFVQDTKLSFHLADGKSLPMASENSIDFVFSMDSLVHVDDIVLNAYLGELSRILTKDGAAFLHHSNLGEYALLLNAIKKTGLGSFFRKFGLIEKNYHWRDMNITAGKIESFAERLGLQCISQELINWGTKKTLLDCFSIIVRKDSVFARKNQVLRNPSFGLEIQRISKHYSFQHKENT